MVFSPQSAAPEPESAPAPTPSKASPPASSVVKAAASESKPSKADEAIKQTIQPTKSTKVITAATMTTFPSVVLPGGDPLDVEHVVIKDEPVQVQIVPEDNDDTNDDDEEDDADGEEEEEEEGENLEEHDNIDIVEVNANEDDHHEIHSSIVEVLSSESSIDPLLPVANHLVEPEYDFLSRQPSEYVEESFRVVNLKGPQQQQQQPKPVAKPKRVQATRKEDNHPTGLVTKLGGTVVKDGATTVHETSVIGTYINGKYAQVLQSTSQVIANKPKITPTSSLRILKTAAPAIPKNRFNVEPTPSFLEEAHSPENPRSKKAPAQSSGSSKNNRFRNRNSKETNDYVDDEYRSSVENKKNRNRPGKKR